MAELATYRGKRIGELTKEELVSALEDMAAYYERRLEDKDRIISLVRNK